MKIISFLAFTLILFSPSFVYASGIEVTPTVMDLEGEARDIFELSFQIVNNNEYKTTIFPLVIDLPYNEIVLEKKLDKTISLASWITIKRGGTDIGPGETITLDGKIEVNPQAIAGMRHATIIFSDSNNIDGAISRALSMKLPETNINFEVLDHIVEKLEISKFSPTQEINLSDRTDFQLVIKNIGNQPMFPKGSIDIYDRKDRLAKSIDINPDQGSILPNEEKESILSWDSGKSIGKYKAKLNIYYGSGEEKNLQDIVFTWIMPLYFIIIIGSIIVLIIVLVIVVYSRDRRVASQYTERKSQLIDLRK